VSESKPVIIVGAGWAGIATAVELSRNKIPVILLESAKQVGGRARRVPFSSHAETASSHTANKRLPHIASVDNGQHILLGAYETTLDLLKTVGMKEKVAFRRTLLHFNMLSQYTKNVKFRVGRLPAPFHLVKALLTAKGITAQDKIRALRFSHKMAEQDYEIDTDICCLDLLQSNQQSERIIKFIWQPLCLAALNTHVEEASAEIFLTTLRETFAHARRDSHFLFPRRDLSALFPDPAIDFIEQHRGQVKLATKVSTLNLENDKIVGVTTEASVYESKFVVLATPFHVSRRLMAPYSELADINQHLDTFETRPICTVYLQYPKRVSMGQEMVGFTDSISQWAVDRTTLKQKGLISVIISGSGNHMDLDNTELSLKVSTEMASFFPRWPKPVHTMVIREKQATFNSTVGINRIRPDIQTPIKGLWLAGDYVNTGLPATIEGAVRSGTRCAREIIKQLHTNK